MKKLVNISIILFLFIVVITSIALLAPTIQAGSLDFTLMDIWQKRTDLRKMFPKADVKENNKSKLEDWARRKGWMEDKRLFEYSPIYSAVIELLDKNNNSLNNRIKNLENNNVVIRNLSNESEIKELKDKLAELENKLRQKEWKDEMFISNAKWITCYRVNPFENNGQLVCPTGWREIINGNGKNEAYFSDERIDQKNWGTNDFIRVQMLVKESFHSKN